MFAGLGMEGDKSGPSSGKIGNDTIYRLDHQVGVDGRRDAVLAQCLADDGAHREIRHVMVIHYVEMDKIRARR